MRKTSFIFFLVALLHFTLCAQNATKNSLDTLHPNRLKMVIGVEVTLYGGTLFALDRLWYNDYPRSDFHLFNDNAAWLQVDKVGHFTTSYYVGKMGYKALKWTGIKDNKSIWYGGSLGFMFLSAIELLDGFSQEWGASIGDVVANAGGSMFFIGQQLAFDEQKAILKFSFRRSGLAKYRPDQLGSGLNEEIIKDYNGQTYWLSCNLNAFYSRFDSPKWLNLAFGYGADGMLTGEEYGNTMAVGVPSGLKRYRQYFLSFDIDMDRIQTKSKVLKVALQTLNFIKIPFPTIEYNTQKGWVLHPLYF
jgi:hypothetical protein